MTTQQIQTMQRQIGVVPDGFWGPKSQSRCREYLRSLMPSPNPWPYSTQEALREFYGAPGDESNLVTIEFPFPMFYDGKRVTKSRCHFKVAASLGRVLSEIGDLYKGNREVIEEAEDYGGIYNFRHKRGGTSYSVHSWGAAIDLDADENTFRDTWPLKADMPLEIMAAFAREGWTSAGAFWGYDAMHHEACKPRA
jgi:hypothetical protein